MLRIYNFCRWGGKRELTCNRPESDGAVLLSDLRFIVGALVPSRLLREIIEHPVITRVGEKNGGAHCASVRHGIVRHRDLSEVHSQIDSNHGTSYRVGDSNKVQGPIAASA